MVTSFQIKNFFGGYMPDDQYLEIYKLHFNNMNEMSNRRVNVNRYYILALSVIVVALSALLGGGTSLVKIFTGSETDKSLNGDLAAFLIFAIGLLGAMLSESWIRNTLGYLETSSHRYEVIKQLECKLKYNFISRTHERVKSEIVNLDTYFLSASHELHAPFIFQLGFTILFSVGIFSIFNQDVPLLILFSITLLILVIFSILRLLELRGADVLKSKSS